ncbi:Hypothetical predicted protein [Podarcis lilfordi]|uniref:Uncharacterized protein n=1 Tax=Podarcis lilfordi TaxID=74358 RepID=A0AA35PL40_9SAUR|nr:Hypothetical predicted protein [Podarcis lilfordi]
MKVRRPRPSPSPSCERGSGGPAPWRPGEASWAARAPPTPRKRDGVPSGAGRTEQARTRHRRRTQEEEQHFSHVMHGEDSLQNVSRSSLPGRLSMFFLTGSL